MRGVSLTGKGASDWRRHLSMPLSPLVRWSFRIALLAFFAVGLLQGVLFAAIAFPGPFFGHARGNGVVTFHAETPLPPEAETVAAEVTALLARAPLGLPGRAVHIWLVEDGLPLRLFFAGSPRASGLTYPVASRENVFLRHADLVRDRLVRDARVVPPPRTLSYFLVHEITHLQVADRVGSWRIVRMPRWINEGYADYVALGPATPALIARVEAGAPLPRARFGTYPRERACVTLALARLGGDADALFALDIDLPAVRGCPMTAPGGFRAPRG
jgi:hypothetical protein